MGRRKKTKVSTERRLFLNDCYKARQAGLTSVKNLTGSINESLDDGALLAAVVGCAEYGKRAVQLTEHPNRRKG